MEKVEDTFEKRGLKEVQRTEEIEEPLVSVPILYAAAAVFFLVALYLVAWMHTFSGVLP